LSFSCSLAGLPDGTTATELLTSSGKKSMLKRGAAWKTGPVKVLDANHTDKAPLKLQIQVSLQFRKPVEQWL
jgi:hypothetical protein